ncbi:MAG: hypothetical protein ACYC0Y_10630 [Pirellulales bacterium]
MICGKPGWCLFTGPEDSPTAAICQRIESDRRAGEAGYLHRLRDSGDWRTRLFSRTLKAAPKPESVDLDLVVLAALGQLGLEEGDGPGRVTRLADDLGLSVATLRRLGIGWHLSRRCWMFPMKSTCGTVLGIRTRYPNGGKSSITGGHEGLFLPIDLPNDLAGQRLLIAEGPTDTAALLDLGFLAIGRPSCEGGVRHIVDLVLVLKPAEVVIVADGDAPGLRGAERLATVLVAYVPAVRTITPPHGVKDARAWKMGGATHDAVQAVIDAAPARKLTISSALRARKAVHRAR